MEFNKRIAVVMAGIILLAAFGGYEAGQLSKRGLESQIRSVQEQLQSADNEIKALREQVSRQTSAAESSPGAGEDSELAMELKASGFEGPEQVARDLQQHPELIPLKAVLGGTMSFSRIAVISGHWAYARYEDGHVAGSTLYSFEKGSNGAIRWKPVVSEQE